MVRAVTIESTTDPVEPSLNLPSSYSLLVAAAHTAAKVSKTARERFHLDMTLGIHAHIRREGRGHQAIAAEALGYILINIAKFG